jgi:hypothetical protein
VGSVALCALFTPPFLISSLLDDPSELSLREVKEGVRERQGIELPAWRGE